MFIIIVLYYFILNNFIIIFIIYPLIVHLLFLFLVSTQLVPSGGLTKGLYAQHHCWALDCFKLGGLFYLSLLLIVFCFGGFYLIIIHSFYLIVTYMLSKMFPVLSGLIYFNGPSAWPSSSPSYESR